MSFEERPLFLINKMALYRPYVKPSGPCGSWEAVGLNIDSGVGWDAGWPYWEGAGREWMEWVGLWTSPSDMGVRGHL